MPRRIAFLVFPDFQLLDTAGPVAVFEAAGQLQSGAYELRVIAATPGPVKSSSGITMLATAFGRADRIDTLVIAGGEGTRGALQCQRTRRFIQGCAAKCRRVTSVCSGSYLLAQAGLLDGKSATTHWSRTPDFARRYPTVHLDADRIFIREGKLWTSAGVSAGIDLALALVREDLGEDISRRTAQQLVLYHRRPGGQSQYSALLEMDGTSARFAPLVEFMRSHLTMRLDVEALAAQARMSPRHFARAFAAEIGVTPAKAVERLRTEAARAALESGTQSVQTIARQCGFRNPERMRRAFVRLYGSPPSSLKHARAP